MKQFIAILTVLLTSIMNFTCTTPPVDPACCKTDGSMQGPGLSHHSVSLSNVLTPNGDGINDVYHVTVYDTITQTIDSNMVVEFTVRNAANVILFLDANYHNSFEGLDDNGNIIPDGNYELEIQFQNGTIFSQTLSLTRVPIQDPTCTHKCKPTHPNDPLLQ